MIIIRISSYGDTKINTDFTEYPRRKCEWCGGQCGCKKKDLTYYEVIGSENNVMYKGFMSEACVELAEMARDAVEKDHS